MIDKVLRRACAVVFVSACASIAAAQSLLDFDNLPRVKPGPPVSFGTTQESFYSMAEWEFDPISSTTAYSDIGIGSMNALRYGTSAGVAAGFFAGPHLPDGAVLTSITYQFCDSNGSAVHLIGGIELCDGLTGLCAILGTPVTSVSNVITPCAEYTEDLSGLNVVVHNRTQRIVVAAITQSGDTTNAFTGAVIGYKLQVSPAPVTATFGDVPTDHPFFQFIEALAKSGITGGCGSGNYCPDNPVTRGQMAVFLAKGLGLQFP
jgi:hypothetical protein